MRHKENKTKMDDYSYFELCGKRVANEKILEKILNIAEGNQKNVIMPKRRKPMTSAETSNYITEVQSRQCTKSLRKYLERKHAHSQDI